MDNQRSFFDNLAMKLDIRKPRDWGNIPFRVVIENKGGYFSFLYRGSMYLALQKIYPSKESIFLHLQQLHNGRKVGFM